MEKRNIETDHRLMVHNMNKIISIKRESVIDKAIEELKRYIMEGDLHSGDFLPPEMELCRMLGIGRSTLREAIKTLELQGFIRKKHGIGMIIVNESDRAARDMLQLMFKRNGSTMEELMDVRCIIEKRTSELAALNATAEDLAFIEGYLKTMQQHMTTQSEYVEADIGFHLAIAGASHNHVYEFILQAIRQLFEEMIQATLKINPRPEHSMKYHKKIFDAISRRDPASAVEAMEQHLVGTRKMITTSTD